jgi:hypothetical protein
METCGTRYSSETSCSRASVDRPLLFPCMRPHSVETDAPAVLAANAIRRAARDRGVSDESSARGPAHAVAECVG